MPKKTVDKGLGKLHRDTVEYMKSIHKDGSLCDWCGRPMYLDPTRNHDYDPSKPGLRGNGVLQGDHSVLTRSEALRRGVPFMPPDRLLHADCNRQRGAGLNDHLAASNQSTKAGELKMPWPWN